MALRIRPATIADAETIAEMSGALARHDGDRPEFLTAEGMRRNGFGPDPQFRMFPAALDGTVPGYALFHDFYEPICAARRACPCDLSVRPAARRRGVARALVAAVARDARQRGRSFVWWASNTRNVSAHAFYRRPGCP